MRKIGSKTAVECPCEYALRYIGGAWKVLIVARLTQVKIHHSRAFFLSSLITFRRARLIRVW
jgi:DNA-binding HxlR family transcriptional regulator